MDPGMLNKEQLDIVLNGNGPVLVIAGPGSGKTRTIVFRICHLLETGTNPESILLLTFTNKAAKEMKSRASGLIGANATKITAGTFHHFANLLLRGHASTACLALKPNFTILDDDDSRALLKQVILEDHESVKRGVLEDVQRVISMSKLRMEPISIIINNPDFFHLQNHGELIESVAKKYAAIKQKRNVVDFDDLLVFAHELLKNPEIQGLYQSRFTSILVDEFQDTDKLQAAIVDLLYKVGSNLMVVGDDSQSIYSFRGAEIHNILEFRSKYSAKIFMLVRNYRSTPQIVSIVNEIISNSKQKLDKELIPILGDGETPSLLNPSNSAEEAHKIAGMVEDELRLGEGQEQRRKIGILFRAAYLAGELELELSRRGIKYDMRGGIRFFEQKHVKDMLSLLKSYHNPSDSLSIVRLLTLFPKIGETRVLKILGNITKPADIMKEFSKLDRSGKYSSLLSEIYSSNANAAAMLDRFYEGFYREYMDETFDDADERKQDIEALVGAASRYQSSSEFLDAFSLDMESPDHAKNNDVVLSTIHQAKGLEWDSVFVIGLIDGVLPHERSFDIEEERRLFYVAASRAKTKLVMSHTSMSGRFYEMGRQRPSRFLLELPSECYQSMFK
jgi:DNA helicase-2/ATP-dependent DNA helicase PcrA